MANVTSLQSFIDGLTRSGTSVDLKPVMFFVGRHYPLLFFSSLLQFFSKKLDKYVHFIDLKIVSKNDAQQQLQSLFLGLKTIFWFGNIADLSATEQQWWIDYLLCYNGPHTIIAYVGQTTIVHKLSIDCIEIPDTVSFDTVLPIALLISQTVDHERLHYFFKKIFEIVGSVSLDQVCLLFSYFCVAGKNNTQFCKELLPSIVQPQPSLFALSDAFFEKNSKKFALLWSLLSSQFSIQFWITFWSEQLWRAYFYSACMKLGRMSDAKKIAYRLPFSFTQKNWKRYSGDPFVKGHAYLYELDHACKNGAVGQEAMLDLFCFEFLASK